MEAFDDVESSSVSSETCETDSSGSFKLSDDAVNGQRHQIVKRNKKEKPHTNRHNMRFNPMSAVAAFRKIDKTVADLPKSFGNISITNATQPLFGKQVIYHGSVTIQKFYGEPSKANFERFKGKNVERTKREEFEKLNGRLNCSSTLEPIITGYKISSRETGNNLITDGKAPFRLVPKYMWLAREQNADISPLDLPAKRVIIAHTETQENFTLSECSNTVKLIQSKHMDVFGWADIGFHFLVGGDGSIYQGRGWDIMGAHTKGYNKDSICIAFIGTFENSAPPDRQLNIVQQFLENGVSDNKLIPNYKLYAQCQLAPFSSPGKKLFEKIQSWPNWTNEL